MRALLSIRMTAASLKTLVTLLAKKPEKDKERMRSTFVEVSFESHALLLRMSGILLQGT